MWTTSIDEATPIYKFQNTDRHIQFKREHPDNIESLSLLDFTMQISTTASIENPPLITYLWISKQNIHSVPKQISLKNEIKRIHNRFSEEKDKITHAAHFI